MRPTICLNMIVRDEAGVVTETIDSVAPFIDYWVIVDTGSTDDTVELIRAQFMRKGIPGELHERPWRNFGVNRTEALELAAGKADYTFVMDADDLLVGTPDLSVLGADSYQLRFGPQSVWWRRQLFRSALPWRYEGVVHEYPTCEEARTEERLGGEYHIVPRHLGARSEDPGKYARDAELLLGEHTRKPGDTRTVFYLAQSYYSAGDPRSALPWYELRAAMGEFAEEVYFSLLRRALCLKWLERPIAEVAQAFLTAWESRPTRAEALCELATAYRGAGKFDLAYLYAKHASEIPFPAEDVLFVDAGVYSWRSLDERAIAGYYVGQFQESADLCRELLSSGALPEGERERVRRNQEFAESRLRPEAVRVKLVGNFASSAEICNQWERQSEGGGRWGDIQVVSEGEADYFAVVNFPRDAADDIDPARTIVFQMEPREIVSQWGNWARPDPHAFAQVRSHDRFPNNAEWYLGLTHEELKTRTIEKAKTLSSVTSDRYALPGQKLRVDFLRYLEAEGTDIDLYGWSSTPLTPHKDDGLLPYKYTFAAENSFEHNYFTEKVVDAILAECLCFYWGCPNLEDHLGADAFVRLPLEDFARSREIIEHSIRDEEWERRLPAIREAKQRLLDDLQFFPTLARSVRGLRFADALDVRVINLNRRPDRWESFRKRTLRAAGERYLERCERFAAIDGSTLQPSPELDHLFRGNTFGLRRGIVGCALSHLSVWREAAEADSPGFLVLEDDARFADGFEGQLVEVCGRLLELEQPFDMAILGYEHWSTENELDRHASSMPPRVAPMAWQNYLGGSSGYIVSRDGARKLVDLVARDGIQDPIDVLYSTKSDELRVVESVPHLVFAPVAFSYASGVTTDIQHDFESIGAATAPSSAGSLGWVSGPSPIMRVRGEVALKTFAPSVQLGEVILDVDPPWPLSNPTVSADDSGIRMLVRSSSNGSTLNYVVRLDASLELVDASPLEAGAGYESCRLVRAGDRWLASATRAGEGVLLTLSDSEVVDAQQIPEAAGWAPFVFGGALHFLAGCAPARVFRYEADSGGLELVSEHETVQQAESLAIHTQGIAVDGGTLFVAYEQIDAQDVVRHAHRFVLLDSDFRLAAASPRFRLASEQAELCTGIAKHGGLLVLSFAIEQRAAGLIVLDAREALDLLAPL